MDELESKDFSSWRWPRTAVSGLATLAVLLVCNAYFAWGIYELRGELRRLRISHARDLAELRENYESSSSTNNRTLKLLIEELTAVRQEAVNAAGKARTEAQRHAERLARRLDQAERERAQRIATDLKEVKSSTTTTQASLATVSSEVAAAKSELATAASDLKRVNGSLGGLSDRIATNASELAALKQLGDRNYFEFDLRRTGQSQRVGDIGVVLRKADAKRNRFTIDVLADDKRVEKRDRTINEPVQFYVSKARQPYEIVVNEIRRDRVIGYLAAPKASVRLAAK